MTKIQEANSSQEKPFSMQDQESIENKGQDKNLGSKQFIESHELEAKVRPGINSSKEWLNAMTLQIEQHIWI